MGFSGIERDSGQLVAGYGDRSARARTVTIVDNRVRAGWDDSEIVHARVMDGAHDERAGTRPTQLGWI